MEQTFNIPIQMISVCSTLGDFTPLRFRYENELHEVETVVISHVVARKETAFNGIRELQFTCEAQIGGILKLFIITYNIASHTWRFFKLLH